MRPVASREGLLVRELAGELVVYDLERHEAHCLNRTAAIVFTHNDGRTTAGEIADRLQAELGVAADEDLVRLAIRQLDEAGLLEKIPPRPELDSRSRRDAVRRIGLGAAVLLPVVTSILVPTPAEAAVTCIPAGACSANVGKECYRFSSAGCGTTCTCQAASCGSSNCCDSVPQPCPY